MTSDDEPLELSEPVSQETTGQAPKQWPLWIAYAIALVTALVAGVVKPGILIFVVAAFAFGIVYAILAWFFGWRRISWLAFVDKVLEYIFDNRRYG